MSDAAGSSKPTLLVRTTEELRAAYETLSNTAGGGEIHLASDAQEMSILLSNGGSEPVLVRSEDPDEPTSVNQIMLGGARNVTVSHVDVNSDGVERADWLDDLHVVGSTNVEISNVTFSSTATEFYDPAQEGTALGESLGQIRNSDNVTFQDNVATAYYHGLRILDSENVDVQGNDFSHFQGDGIRMDGVTNVMIEGNTFRDFLGSVHSFNHDDMIQIWSTRPDKPATNVTITGNVFDSGDGAATQTIFIRNEQFDGGVAGAQMHSDIEISNNLIYNGHVLGIGAYGVDGLDISNNSLFWNKDSIKFIDSGDSGNSYAPEIRSDGSLNVNVSNNVTGGLSLGNGIQQSNNLVLDYRSPEDPNFIGTHFLNVPAGEDSDPRDISFLSDSPYNTLGSTHVSVVTESDDGVVAQVFATVHPEDVQTLTLDARFSVDEAGFVDDETYQYRWTLPDGEVVEGIAIDHTFTEHGVQDAFLEILKDGVVVAEKVFLTNVASRDFLILDFDNGFVDNSSHSSAVVTNGATLVETEDGMGIRIGDGKTIGTTRDATQYHDLKSFALELDMEVQGESSGSFMRFGLNMWGLVHDDGNVTFTLTTADGNFTVDSKDVSVHDGRAHNIMIGYSDAAGKLVLVIDDEIVDSVAASGATAPQGPHGFILGSPWNAPVEAIIDNLYFGSSPQSLGLEIKPDSVFMISSEADKEHADQVNQDEPDPVNQDDPDPVNQDDPDPVNQDGPDPVNQGQTNSGNQNSGDLVHLDFEGVDWTGGTLVATGDADNLVQSHDGTGFAIGGHERLVLDRSNIDLRAKDAFGMSLELQIENSSDTGFFIHLPNGFIAEIDKAGQLNFFLYTDEGTFTVSTSADPLMDGQPHTLGFGYSAEAGSLKMLIDGQEVAETEASGTTSDTQQWGLALGSMWHETIDAVIDNFRFTETAEEVGIAMSTGEEDQEVVVEDLNAEWGDILPFSMTPYQVPQPDAATAEWTVALAMCDANFQDAFGSVDASLDLAQNGDQHDKKQMSPEALEGLELGDGTTGTLWSDLDM